ncbi:ribonuclease H-like domain-containing protein, partial [Trichophaea hybrida]
MSSNFGSFFCRHCGDRLATRSELRYHLTTRHPSPTVTNAAGRQSLIRGTGTDSNPTPPTQSKFCDVCEREFRNEAGLQMHVQNSKVHKKAKRQQLKEANNATLSSSSKTVIPSTITPGYNHWTVVPTSQQLTVFETLIANCHSPDDLLKNQYLLQPYGPEDFEALRKCKNCGGVKKKLQSRAKTECVFHPGKRQIPNKNDKRRLYSCCDDTGRGCASRPAHDYMTPDRRLVAKYQEYSLTPTHSHRTTTRKRQAVVLDCEMAGVVGGAGELILLCVADYLTGETLLNTLVRPTMQVVDWRTRVSGVTQQAMTTAIYRGEALSGWKEARLELWKHIDADTILIGHSLQHDLDVLRIIHTRVVDSAILARNAADPNGRQWGLKTMCDELLHLNIQTNGMRGHDCFEDVMATREVVLHCTRKSKE